MKVIAGQASNALDFRVVGNQASLVSFTQGPCARGHLL
jgi:hypothetical protein